MQKWYLSEKINRLDSEILNILIFFREVTKMIDIENDEKNKQSSRVKVAIRVRPMIQR